VHEAVSGLQALGGTVVIAAAIWLALEPRKK
jgi:hypothetical protein